MKILMVGDIVGGVGRRMLVRTITQMRQAGAVDVVIANAENAAGGKGLTAKLAHELLAAGVDVLTLGDHAWDQQDIMAFLERDERIIRPANFPPGCPGRGTTQVCCHGVTVTVISLLGRTFMNPQDCPFRVVDHLLKFTAPGVVLVEFHAEATSEKNVMGHYLDGRVSAVVGSHTHVQTSDARLLPKGTAYQTDLGMTGPRDGSIGMELSSITRRFLTGLPCRFEVADGPAVVEGAMLDVDNRTGKVRAIKAFRQQEVKA